MAPFDRSRLERPIITEASHAHLAEALRTTEHVTDDLLNEAADRIDRLDRLQKLLGLLAPSGTAPRTALEQIYDQSASGVVEESPILLDLRRMLRSHWGEWTPALREAEGLPPAGTVEP